MGKRCEKEMRKIVFDLDGTLISFNTFKGWILISFIVPFLSLNFKSFKYISELILLRASKKISRTEFKELLLIYQSTDSCWNKIGALYAFLAFFFIRKKLLNEKKEKDTICLATAAPDIYVLPLSKKIDDFDLVLSTYISSDNKMVEIFGELKKEFVINNFTNEPDLFFTDHYDDAPLARISKKTFFVKPSNDSKRKIAKDNSIINYVLLK